MSDDPKELARQLLCEGIREAAATVFASIKGTLRYERGSTRTADARWLLDAVLDLPDRGSDNKPDVERVQVVDAAQFRAATEALAQSYQAKRAPAQDDN